MAADTTFVGDRELADLGTPGWLTPEVDLVTAFSGTPDKNLVIGDVTKAAYTGYAATNPALSNPYIRQPQNQIAFAAEQSVFLGPSSGAGASIVGWVLTDGATAVYAYEQFDAPINLESVMDRLSISMEFPIPGGCSTLIDR